LFIFQKTAQSKQLPERRKFAQSGHPVNRVSSEHFRVFESRVARWFMYFQTKNPDLGKFCSLAIEDVGIFYCSLVYLTYGHLIFYGHFIYFMVLWYIFPIWHVVPRKIWQPCLKVQRKERQSFTYFLKASSRSLKRPGSPVGMLP
jgi:hypothetical protein